MKDKMRKKAQRKINKLVRNMNKNIHDDNLIGNVLKITLVVF